MFPVKLATLASMQHGLFPRAQALKMGVAEGTLDGWLATGRIELVQPSVYRFAGAPDSWEQRLLAAVLSAGAGAVASHRSAARLWGIGDSKVVEITVSRPLFHRLRGVIVHRSRDLAKAQRITRRGVPATDPMRTLVDLGAVASDQEVEDALDRAVSIRLVAWAGVELALGLHAKRGRRGCGPLRRVLDRWALGPLRPASVLEARMARLMLLAELPRAVFQFVVRDSHGKSLGRVDFAYPLLRIAIEVDGFAYHSSPRATAADLARQQAIEDEGWIVLRFTWNEVVKRPSQVVNRIRTELGASTADIGGERAQNVHQEQEVAGWLS